jgi:hypothetical protein
VPGAVVGNKLETSASVVLGEVAPAAGLDVTLRSDDPSKLLISGSPDHAGAAMLILHVRNGVRESPEFWLQGLSNAGNAGYTATAPEFESGMGIVSLKPSAIVIIGPLKAPRFPTTVRGEPTTIRLMSARLEESLDFAEEQAVAGGVLVEPDVTNSRPSVGAIVSEPPAITGGTSSQIVQFQPAAEGETTLSTALAPGFSAPKQFASLTMVVRKPGLAVSEQLYLGQNLQIAGVLSLGEMAPAAGLRVTLTSEDPERLLLSASATEIGAEVIVMEVPPGEASGQYYLQGLGNTGSVRYTASAEGFQTRTGTLVLAPSGILLTPESQGPPDEAHVLRKEAPDGTHRLAASLAHPVDTSLIAWTAQLDPVTHRGADITVQPLRAGLNLSISLTNSNPTVADVATSVAIKGGFDHGSVVIEPRGAGSAEIEVGTPMNFIHAANSTKVIAVVTE